MINNNSKLSAPLNMYYEFENNKNTYIAKFNYLFNLVENCRAENGNRCFPGTTIRGFLNPYTATRHFFKFREILGKSYYKNETETMFDVMTLEAETLFLIIN